MAKPSKPMGVKRAVWGRAQIKGLRRADALLDRIDRLDGKLENALTGLGRAGVDQATATRRVHTSMTAQQAREEYRGSWAARAEVDRPARDLVREGFAFVDLPPWVDQAAVWSYMDDVGSETIAVDVPEDRGVVAALSRLHAESHKGGGAALLMNVDDGLPPWEPLDLSRVRSLRSLELLERDEITPLRVSVDGRSKVEHYMIGSVRSAMTPGSIVHASRLIISKGARLSPSEEYVTGWGASVLDALQTERNTMHTAAQESAALILKLVTDVAYIAELNEALCSDDATERAAPAERIALLAQTRSQHRVALMDAGRDGNEAQAGRPSDRFESIARPVEGVQKLLEASENHWAGASGQTPSIALGKLVGNLSSGEHASSWQSWGGRVSGEQQYWLRPRLDQVLIVIFAAKDGPTGGQIPETWGYEFAPLWRPSESDLEANRKTRTETDLLMQGAGWVTAEQVAEQRLVKGSTGELTLEFVNPPPSSAQTAAPGGQPVADAGAPVDRALAELVFDTVAKLRSGELDVDMAMMAISMAAPGVDAYALREQLMQSFPPAPKMETEQDAEDEPDPVEQALAEIPRDLRTSTQLAAELTEEFGLQVTPHKITSLASAGRLRRWPHMGGRDGISRAQARRVLAEQFGVIEPEATEGEPESESSPEPDAEPKADSVEQRGEAWVVLSEDGDVIAKYTGPDAENQARERLRQIEAAKAAKGDDE